jgi:hypothetical protein
MDLNSLPTVSDKIILADISPAFKALEDQNGETPAADRVWVIVGQATEEDHRNRAQLTARRESSITLHENGQIASASDAVTENVFERIMFETYATLRDIGNLVKDGKPIFAEMPAKKMKRAAFEKTWGGLPLPLCEAIHKAVRSMNPDWDWERGKA